MPIPRVRIFDQDVLFRGLPCLCYASTLSPVQDFSSFFSTFSASQSWHPQTYADDKPLSGKHLLIRLRIQELEPEMKGSPGRHFAKDVLQGKSRVGAQRLEDILSSPNVYPAWKMEAGRSTLLGVSIPFVCNMELYWASRTPQRRVLKFLDPCS
jgi:hypothetical protein